MPLTVQDIARVCRCPIAAVASNWPRITAELEARGLRSDLGEVAAAATIAVESAHTFRSINEYGGEEYFRKHYEGRFDLGNVFPGDGAKYHGRGLGQITGRGMYRAASNAAGVDLETNPEKALDTDVSARVFAWVFAQKRIAQVAAIQDWERVRRRWNGGLNGWDDFKGCVDGLLELIHG